MQFTIKPLTQALAESWLDFFDNRAFSDNPDWAWCYCFFFYHRGTVKEWMARSASANREEAQRLIKAGLLKGFLAFRGDEPVGWCNANVKSVFSLDKNRQAVAGPHDDEIAAIVCFVIAPEYRRKGVCSALLASAVEYYGRSGLSAIEAYPARNPKSDADHYHGPLALYLRHGFEVVKELDSYLIVSRAFEERA